MRSVYNQMHKGLHFQTRAKVDESEEDSDDEQDDEEEEHTVSNVEAESSKRNLNAEDLILPFNCCHDYKKWTVNLHRVLLTDNGSNFKSTLFESVLQLLEVKHSLTAPYHKSANGTIERVHRTIEESLSSFVNSKQTDWDQKLPFIIFSINSSHHAVTKVSPHRALFGRELTTPEDIQLGPKPKDCIGSSYLDLEDFEECLKRHLQDLHIIIQGRIKDQIGRNKERHMKTHRVKERKVQLGSKIFNGPFEVLKVDRYNVEYADGEKRKIANTDDVRLEGSGEEEISEGEDDEETQEVPEESEEDEDDGSSGTDRRSSKRIDGIKRKGRKRHENGSNNNGKRGGFQNRKTKSRNDETDSSNNLRRSERIKNKRFSRFKSLSMFKVMYCTVSSSCSSQLDLAHDSKTSQDHHCMDHPTDYDKMSNANVNDERKFQNDKLEYQNAECLNEYDVKIWSMARRTVRRSRSRRSTLRSDGMLPEGPPLYARSSGGQAVSRCEEEEREM
ncbi:Protein CBG16472 [Caenorhabditis briggsae]|uniref:Protein CBG16472 n=1 Tax=Caenorhabditis briggsae TaxID=6238 RepID=A8XP49_CAEBR|nr:Protein CBG16472 [Caenorhabditis briggsae]CAP34425.2 Protein CBG16472 [Caenorhabditis briggsae]